MVDAKHAHNPCLVVDLVHDPVGTTTRRPETNELSLKRMSDAARGLNESTEHELHDRGCDSLG